MSICNLSAPVGGTDTEIPAACSPPGLAYEAEQLPPHGRGKEGGRWATLKADL